MVDSKDVIAWSQQVRSSSRRARQESRTVIEASRAIRRRSFHLRSLVVHQTYQGVEIWDASEFALRMRGGEFCEDLHEQLEELTQEQLHALARVLNR